MPVDCVTPVLVLLALLVAPVYGAIKGVRWWVAAEVLKVAVVAVFLAIGGSDLLHDWRANMGPLLLVWFPVYFSTFAAGIIFLLKATARPPDPDRCTSCGYDLRATPDRCPECGAVPEGKGEGRREVFPAVAPPFRDDSH